MTAVARLSINQHPLLIGDLVLSGEERDKGSIIRLPTVGPHTRVFPAGSGFTITGLRQKIALVRDNIAIAWAGNRVAAATIIKELIERSESEPFTLDSLGSYLRDLPLVKINREVGLVGWIRSNNRVTGFGFRSREFSSSRFGRVGVLGSGSVDFEDYLASYPELPEGDHTDHPWTAVSKALILCGFLLRGEMHSHASLLQYYGAGYEIVSMNGPNFQKCDDVTYVFWEAELIGRKVSFSLQPRLFKYLYHGDVLLIRSVSLDKPGQTNDHVIASHTVEAVPPIYRDIDREEIKSLPVPAMTSKVLCNYFLIRLPNNVTQVFSHVQYCEPNGPAALIQFNESGGNLGAKIDPEQMSEISQEVGERIKGSRHQVQ